MKTYDRVQFHSTGSSDLDGKQGVILGIATAYTENNFWIVKLDQALPERAAVITSDACLTEV